MRTLILAACAALLVFAAPAKASFSTDDRYFDSSAVHKNVQQNVRKSGHRKIRHVGHRARNSSIKSVLAPRLKYHKTTWGAPRNATPVSEGVQRVVPGARPRAWCGWWLGRQLGMLSRNLWLARNWASVGSPSGKHVGAIVVWNHHVGRITGVRADGAIKVLSGNDGHAVRDRWRSARGVIAYRAL